MPDTTDSITELFVHAERLETKLNNSEYIESYLDKIRQITEPLIKEPNIKEPHFSLQLKCLIAKLNNLQNNKHIKDHQDCETHYLLSLCYSTQHEHNHADNEWNCQPLTLRLLHLRLGIVHTGFRQIPDYMRSRMLAEMGTALSLIGRSFEGIRYLLAAANETERFMNAHLNYEVEIGQITLYVPDAWTQQFIREIKKQRGILERDLNHYESNNPNHPNAVPRHELEERVQRPENIALEGLLSHGYLSKLNESYLKLLTEHRAKLIKEPDPIKKNYSNWVSKLDCWLNYGNCLTHLEGFPFDDLSLPKSKYVDQSTTRMFNELVKQYQAARFLSFSSLHGDYSPLSPRHTPYENEETQEFNIELMKSSFMTTYSLFDKIAYFIDHYWKTGLDPAKINFRSVWHDRNQSGKVLHERFNNSENWPLRGLYWISKDVLEKDSDLPNSIEPLAKDILHTRNRIAHRLSDEPENFDQLHEQICTLLQMTHAAIMGLRCAVDLECSLSMDKEINKS